MYSQHAARYYYFVTGQVDTKMQYVVSVGCNIKKCSLQSEPIQGLPPLSLLTASAKCEGSRICRVTCRHFTHNHFPWFQKLDSAKYLILLNFLYKIDTIFPPNLTGPQVHFSEWSIGHFKHVFFTLCMQKMHDVDIYVDCCWSVYSEKSWNWQLSEIIILLGIIWEVTVPVRGSRRWLS